MTVNEAKQTGPLVHKIKSEATDDRYKDFVDLFSLQLMHQTVKFSPCGFFDVDFTLLFAMTGAITTYLVILIQFHLSAYETPDDPITTTQITDLALISTTTQYSMPAT
ncbi:gustatory receptor for bitter taste 66a-like [Ctenocephalides felis]|uniref:gustatory receptor for bitter taste 66a-like n=1 Tax=Ctenocephalides felis TaxID=7515 RepID=UPI000E6E542B|nr:gustatory receptor for bitter taste 66a-like [Ctenocephalides felis]